MMSSVTKAERAVDSQKKLLQPCAAPMFPDMIGPRKDPQKYMVK